MPRKFIALFFVLSAACHAPAPERSANPAPDASSTAEIDLSACSGRSIELVEFLKSCQQASGFNFTYSERVATALAAAEVRLTGTARFPRADFQDFLVGVLEPRGFVLRPIGPAELRVLEIRLAGS